MSSDGSRSAPCPSLIWIDPRTWMRPTPARAARLLPQRSAIQIRDGFGSARRSILGMDSAALSPLADPCITVGAAEEVHPLPTANAHQHGRRPPSRPPYGRRLAAHRAPPSKLEAHHAAAGMHRPRPYFSGRFRSGSDLREIQISLESGAHTISFEMLRPTSCASSERLGASPHQAPKPIS